MGKRISRYRGNIPFNISNDAYRSNDEGTYTEPDYDLRQLEQPRNEREEMLASAHKKINNAATSEKNKQYFRDTLAGYGPTELGKKYGVSKANVSQALRTNLKKVQDAVDESYIEKLNSIFT